MRQMRFKSYRLFQESSVWSQIFEQYIISSRTNFLNKEIGPTPLFGKISNFIVFDVQGKVGKLLKW